MVEKKLGNTAQICFAQDVLIANKHCVLVMHGALEILFNKDNALDIVWVRYKGVNLSFLSKNGLNDGQRDFTGNFEGGFLYTCGMDNVSSCVPNKSIHGSLHYKQAADRRDDEDNQKLSRHLCQLFEGQRGVRQFLKENVIYENSYSNRFFQGKSFHL